MYNLKKKKKQEKRKEADLLREGNSLSFLVHRHRPFIKRIQADTAALIHLSSKCMTLKIRSITLAYTRRVNDFIKRFLQCAEICISMVSTTKSLKLQHSLVSLLFKLLLNAVS